MRERPISAAGLLAEFIDAGMLQLIDFHLARRVGQLADEADPRVLLALALAVRELRLGSVCLDLMRAHELTPEGDLDDGTAADPTALRWPEPASWVDDVAASRTPVRTAAASRPTPCRTRGPSPRPATCPQRGRPARQGSRRDCRARGRRTVTIASAPRRARLGRPGRDGRRRGRWGRRRAAVGERPVRRRGGRKSAGGPVAACRSGAGRSNGRPARDAWWGVSAYSIVSKGGGIKRASISRRLASGKRNFERRLAAPFRSVFSRLPCPGS
mgnify:CR=1 FL=1